MRCYLQGQKQDKAKTIRTPNRPTGLQILQPNARRNNHSRERDQK